MKGGQRSGSSLNKVAKSNLPWTFFIYLFSFSSFIYFKVAREEEEEEKKKAFGRGGLIGIARRRRRV